MKIPIEKTPLDLRRKAAQHLESMSASELDGNVKSAKLGGTAYMMYRPDLNDDVAYIEFTVTVKGEPAGFIILSTGDHDFPVPHFSFNQVPISDQLEKNSRDNDDISRVYKLDALSYVAENNDGEILSQVGQIPAIIDGLPGDPNVGRGDISESVAKINSDLPDDKEAEGTEHKVIHEGSSPPSWEYMKIKKFNDVKEFYSKSFHSLLSDLQQRAKPVWEFDSLIEEFGEGLMANTSHPVALLENDVDFKIEGDAAQFIKAVIKERADTRFLELTVGDLREDKEIEFKVHLFYSNGLEESLNFFVTSSDVHSNNPSNIDEEK